MEYTLARAMQMSYLTEDEIKRIHTVENRCQYCLPNWNIQNILGVQSVKSRYNMPEDDDAANERHANRLREEIKKLFRYVESGEDIGNVCALNVQKAHSFDWAVYNHSNEIDWVYKGKTGRSKLMEQFL